MQALVWEGPRRMSLRSVNDPQVGPDEALIRVAYSGICGSELSGYLGQSSIRKPPLIMGHEFSGEIVALGDQAAALNPRLSVGSRVTANPLLHSPYSPAAVRGCQNLSRDRRIIGAHLPGSYDEYVIAPAANVYSLPDDLTLEIAALTEPLACAIRAARLSQSAAGAFTPESVLITGLGPIGLLTALILKGGPSARGIRRIIATDTDADRRAIGASFGLHVLDPVGDDVVETVLAHTDGEGVAAAIDAVGIAATRNTCVRTVRWGGTVVLVGLHTDETDFPVNHIIRSEIALQGSFAYTTADFEDALQWLTGGGSQLQPWLMHAPLSEGHACFERLLTQPGPVLKILLSS